ncbi:MAG: FimB/Mfa2 family fimbrial subunit [Rikenellaceae bacterium]|nr:FimB/Mfa2 family fimbrial subunit [Rikenellaceae bacterium]
MWKRWVRLTCYVVAVAVLGSCIKDDREDCYDPAEFLLYIKAVDTATGQDITSGGDAGEVMVALFDSLGRFVASRVLAADEVTARRPWTITDFDMAGKQVSAWGALGEDVEQSPPATVQGGFIRLPVDDEGWSAPPGDLFFGLDTIPSTAQERGRGEVVVTQKNAKLHVTVRGLRDSDDERYYFVYETPDSGYDFSGRPEGGRCRIRQAGRFNGDRELVSAVPCLLIHSTDPDNAGPGEGAVVRLMERAPDGDLELAVAQRTETGGYIALYPGRTTNVLIDLSGSASATVRVEVTGWNETFLWSEW